MGKVMSMMPGQDGCIRVLELNSGSRNYGGVSSFLFNVYQNIDRSRVQFDFLSPSETTYRIHQKEIESMGGRIVELNIRGNAIYSKIALYCRLKKVIEKNHYQIIHINSGNFFFNLSAVMAARRMGVKVRIVHSHNAGDMNRNIGKKLLFGALKPMLEKSATDLLACSSKAAGYMFTPRALDSGRVTVVYNGILPERFAFNEELRSTARKEFKIENKFVIGHVGRFEHQKNHSFLIDIFYEIHKRERSAFLLLAGEGMLEREIREKADALGIGEYVRFMGVRNDVEKLYQAMDVFVLPSFHEGLPVTGIEAQASGLPMVVSNTVTPEVKILDTVSFVELSDSPGVWADIILSYKGTKRKDCSEKISDSGYNIQAVAKKMEEFYLESLKV